MSSKLFGRSWRVLVGGVDVSNLDLEFDIHKSLRPEPNTCSVRVFNLSEAHRRAVEALNIYEPVKRTPTFKTNAAERASAGGGRGPKAGRIPVEVHAGYDGRNSLLFRGDLRRATSERDGASWVTEVEGEDGGRSILTARVSQTLKPGSTLRQAAEHCAGLLGVGRGNLGEFSEELSRTFPTGAVLDGSASRELAGVLRRVQLSFSVQNGVLQVVKQGKGAAPDLARVPFITPANGLVGEPRRNATGEIEITCLLLPDIAPGGYVRLESRQYQALYSVQVADHVGSTFGTEWYHKLALVPA